MGKLDYLSMPAENADEFMKKCREYASLKRGSLETLPEDEIILAVTCWIEGKFEEDWSDMCEVINSLPTPCLNVYCADYITKEILNGGFSQAFFNTSGDFITAASDGFHAIGDNKTADLIERAAAVHGEKGKSCGGKGIEDFTAFFDDNPLNELDDEFYAVFSEKIFSSLARAYILKNAKYFGEE